MTIPKLVDPVTKRHLIMLLCKVVENRKPDYVSMHRFAKSLQDMLETKYGYTLGYRFTDLSIYDIWSNKFQEDIERYDASGNVLDSKDDIISLRRPDGEFLLDTTGKYNLEKHFGNMEKLTEELRLSIFD